MQPPTPFFREAGSGPGVVCLHANAGSSSQWRALTEMLAPRYRVLAADSYGAGKSPVWPRDRPLFLRDEVALLEPVLEAFSRLDVPVLYMTRKDSPASSLGVARLLTRALPRVEVVEFEGLGHMGPVTHPEVVNEAIVGFLERAMLPLNAHPPSVGGAKG